MTVYPDEKPDDWKERATCPECGAQGDGDTYVYDAGASTVCGESTYKCRKCGTKWSFLYARD